MGCNPNWSYITHALMLMLQINHWRLVQTGLTGHCDVAFAFVFALIILYKWTLGCFFTDSDSDNQWSRFHRIDIHFTLLGVGLGAVWIRPWSKTIRKQSNRTLSSNRAAADVSFTTSTTVISHPCFTDHIGAGQWSCFQILAFYTQFNSSVNNKFGPIIIDQNKQHHIDHFCFFSVWKKRRSMNKVCCTERIRSVTASVEFISIDEFLVAEFAEGRGAQRMHLH